MRAGQRDLRLVVAFAARGDDRVSGDPFGRRRRRREAQVEIAAPRRELA
jgi:hypothetical protein